MELTGIIKFISNKKVRRKMNKVYHKKMVVFQQDNRFMAYIEFRGDLIEKLDTFKSGDRAKIVYTINTSLDSGNYVNNLIATNIE